MSNRPTIFTNMIKYLDKYKKLWPIISLNNPPIPCLNMINSDVNISKYYGYNFADTNNVFCLFHSDSQGFKSGLNLGPIDIKLNSDTDVIFSAICYLRNKTKADLCPIFLINVTTGVTKYIGNFRTYIKKLIGHCLLLDKKNIVTSSHSYTADKFISDLNDAMNDLNKFSDDFNYRKYQLVKN